MKKAVVILLFLLFTTPCFATDYTADPRRENYIALRDYLERLFIEQNRYIDTRFGSIDRTFSEKQRALEVGASVLDAKFVKIDEFIKRTSAFDSSISTLSSRMTVMETTATAQDKQAAGQKDQSAALVAKWGLGLGTFFTLIQILIAVFITRRKGGK